VLAGAKYHKSLAALHRYQILSEEHNSSSGPAQPLGGLLRRGHTHITVRHTTGFSSSLAALALQIVQMALLLMDIWTTFAV